MAGGEINDVAKDTGQSGHRVDVVVAKRVGAQGHGTYKYINNRRGLAENHIKTGKHYLAASRFSCHRATVNQFGQITHSVRRFGR